MNEELLKDILSDGEFTQSLLEMETAEEVQAALKEKGADLTLADIEAVKNALVGSKEEELDENDLENVSGGSLTILAACGIAGLISAAVGGTIAIGDGVNRWTRRRW